MPVIITVIPRQGSQERKSEMTRIEIIKNQMWELKYQMLQAICGLSDDQIRAFSGDHWPIAWHFQHCTHVLDFMINTHVSGNYTLDHDPEYKGWPLKSPTPEWQYPSILQIQKRWLILVDGILNTLDRINEIDLDGFTETAYNSEPLVESFLRVINHTHTHIATIWKLTSSVHTRLPDQGIWMPRSDLISTIKTELSQRLAEVGNSQSPAVRSIARKYFPKISHHDIWTILENCEDLMATRNTWLQMLANAWIEKLQNRLQEHHFYHFERWLFFTWGTGDSVMTSAREH